MDTFNLRFEAPRGGREKGSMEPEEGVSCGDLGKNWMGSASSRYNGGDVSTGDETIAYELKILG